VPVPVPVPVPVWMDLAGADDPAALDPDDFYLARAGWWPDGSVMAQVQNRRQTVLQVLRLDPSTGAREVCLLLML
jgi:dipeptidyl-peptidase-4